MSIKHKVGTSWLTHRKVDGHKRLVRVMKMSSKKYRVRLVNPKANSAGKKYNYGRSWALDQTQFNKRQDYERKYRGY